MYILRQLPFRDAMFWVEVAGESIAIRAYQIVIWVSLSPGDSFEAASPRFPAILDTGHNHNLSIQERQLTQWAAIRPDALPHLGHIVVNRQEVPLLSAKLWIHRNRPQMSEVLSRPYGMELPQGIAVYREGTPGAPRLPLLGLRGLVNNRLQLTVDGANRWMSLRTSSPSRRMSRSPRRR
jgi:hypothetical protein